MAEPIGEKDLDVGRKSGGRSEILRPAQIFDPVARALDAIGDLRRNGSRFSPQVQGAGGTQYPFGSKGRAGGEKADQRGHEKTSRNPRRKAVGHHERPRAHHGTESRVPVS